MSPVLPVSPASVTSQVVVQHNLLLNARFELSTVEMHLLLAMLSRIGRNDSKLDEMHIPLPEIMARSGRRPSVKDYRQLAGMCNQLVSRCLQVERPVPVGRQPGRGGTKLATQSFNNIPLLAYAEYQGEEGGLRVRFSDELRPYLLHLHQDYTEAWVAQLLKLRSPHAYRIYWLLREYAPLGTRTLGVGELKGMLGLTKQYAQFPLFRLRVLERARAELAQTDLPFAYELLREGRGRGITHLRFTFATQRSLAAAPLAEPARPAWQQQLYELGMAAQSVAVVSELVAQGKTDADYVQYVVRAQQARFAAGQLNSLPGAIFSAITKHYRLADFGTARLQARPVARRPTGTAAASRCEKLLAELADAHTSLRFVLTAPAYTTETRPAAEAEVRAHIARVETQLHSG